MKVADFSSGRLRCGWIANSEQLHPVVLVLMPTGLNNVTGAGYCLQSSMPPEVQTPTSDQTADEALTRR